MDLVVDANVIFAAIIKESKSYDLLFDERLHLLTAEFFFTEFKNHAEELQKKSGKSKEEINHLLDILKNKIEMIPLGELVPYLDEAEGICPDPDDVAYFALALKMKCGIWTNDRDLKEKQNVIQVYSTEDLIRMV